MVAPFSRKLDDTTIRTHNNGFFMTKLTVSFFAHGIDGHGGVSREVILDTAQPASFAPTNTRTAWICPKGNSNLDVAARRYDETLSYVIQQEDRSLAVAAALYAVQKDTRGGPPADVKIKLEEGHAVDAANAEKLIDIVTSMGRAFENEFVREWLLQSSRNGTFDVVCDRIVTDHAAQIGQLTTVDVSQRNDHRLSARVRLDGDSYRVAQHLPKSFETTDDYRDALRDIALDRLIHFQNAQDQMPIVIVGDEAAELLSKRMTITKISPVDKRQLARTLAAAQPAVEKTAPVAETFAQAAEVLTADAHYAIIMKHLTELAKASKDRGPDGADAREKILALTRTFAGGIAVLKANGPNK